MMKQPPESRSRLFNVLEYRHYLSSQKLQLLHLSGAHKLAR